MLDRNAGLAMMITRHGASPVLQVAFAAIEIGEETLIIPASGAESLSRWTFAPAVGIQDDAGPWRWAHGWPRRLPLTPARGRWIAAADLGSLCCYDPAAGTITVVLPPGTSDPNRPSDDEGDDLHLGGADVVPVVLAAQRRPKAVEVRLSDDLPAEHPGRVIAEAWLGRRRGDGLINVSINGAPVLLPDNPASDYREWRGEWADQDSLPGS